MSPKPLLQKIYWTLLFFITMSGFAQMPIFKRYYIADIPGFGWLAKFYITHILHYTMAFLLIVFVFYVLFNLLLTRSVSKKIAISGYIHAFIIIGLIISGVLMMVKNLPGIYMNHSMIIILDLTHLGSCMLLLLVSLYLQIKKRDGVFKGI